METVNWHSLVDWYGFTVNVGEHGKLVGSAIGNLNDCIIEQYGDESIAEIITCGDKWEFRSGRRPYKGGYASYETGRYVWAGGHSHVLIEFTGQGCEYLRNNNMLSELMRVTARNATRLDVACDKVTDISPTEFVNAGYTSNVKSLNSRNTPDGKTVTIGSWKSDRFVNVYRYNPPHPRSDRLRVEFRLKRDYAKSGAAYAAYYGPAHVIGMLDNSYKFESKEWQAMKVNERLPGAQKHKNKTSTLMWVINQVAPAVKRLIREGVIENPNEFFNEHFIPENKQESMF